ncbi:NAD-dependent epimerase/dehydratase family protein [Rhizorhabdus argentea]|uniref:NAD-dependent epimerase/dehydratase family protein n=1 Tax=Rhizorhabdus argentea TaxID=1387174 RepID=UPI0030EC7005
MGHVLVTGGSGNIGMYAVAEFIRRGHQVTVLDRETAAPMLMEVAPEAKIVAGDILDVEHLSDVIRNGRIDSILHLAAYLGPESVTSPIKAMDVNCRGTANIFDLAIQHGVRQVCWTSSIAAVGTLPDYDGRPVDESYRIASTTTYGASKYYGELISAIYRGRGLDVRCVRAAFAFGLGKLTGSWGANYNRVIYNAALGKPSIFPSWAKTGMQMIYNKDQGKLCVEATLSPPSEHWLFNTPTEKAFSEEEVIDLIRDVVPDADITRDYTPPPGSAFPPNVDGSRAVRELGFSPDYSVRDGIAEMVDYYRRDGHRAVQSVQS